jgi:hypothetical protein
MAVSTYIFPKYSMGRVAIHVLPLVGGGAGTELIPSRPDASGEVRQHAASVVDEEAQTGMPLENAGEHDRLVVGGRVGWPI